MDFRRLIEFGKSSYVVSLPKRWVMSNRMKRGDIIVVEENGDELCLYAKERDSKTKESKSIIIDIEKKPLEMVETEIVSAYLVNHDTIEVRGADLSAKIAFIKNVFKNLPGMEIMEEDSRKIIFKDLIDINEVSVKVLIRRIDIIIRGMLEDSIRSVHENAYESIFQRDFEVNRLCFLSHRILRSAFSNPGIHAAFKMSYVDLLTHWSLTTRLEKIGDGCKRIARLLKGAGMAPKMRKELEATFRMLQQAYLSVMKAYYDHDIPSCHQIELNSKARAANILTLLKQKPDATIARIVDNLNAINSSIRMISRHVLNLE